MISMLVYEILSIIFDFFNIGMYKEKISENIGLGTTLMQVDHQNVKVFLLKSDTDSKVFSYIYSVHY